MLSGIQKFESVTENFIVDTFIYFQPMKRFENGSGRGVSEFRSFIVSLVMQIVDT